MTKFKKGESVKLKAGGPKMSILETFSDKDYRCGWFAGKKFETGIFPEEALVQVPDDVDENG
jgi:uncharacterized protein YodC (DUF2158 family)